MLPPWPGSLNFFLFHKITSVTDFDHSSSRLTRPLVGLSLFSGLLTIALFLYILLIPLIKGIPPNVRPSRFSESESPSLHIYNVNTPLRWRLTDLLRPYPSPLVAPRPFYFGWLFLWVVGSLVSVVEKIRRTVISHSGASRLSSHYPPYRKPRMLCIFFSSWIRGLTKTNGSSGHHRSSVILRCCCYTFL
jgi:hypothetical protein